MTIVSGLLLVPLSYLATAWAIATLFSRVQFPSTHRAANFVLALPLAPLAQAWLLAYLFRFWPHQPRWLYAVVIQAALLIPVVVWRQEARHVLGEVIAELRALSAHVRRQIGIDKAMSLVGLLALTLFGLTVLQIFSLPVVGSDPLEYMSLSRLLYGDVSLARYPLEVAAENGLYARSAHPPSYHMMIVWTYILQGGSQSSLALRCIQLVYLVALPSIIAYALARATGRPYGGLAAVAAATFLLCVPAYTILVSQLHIDSMRITLYALAFVFMAELLVRLDQDRGAPRPFKHHIPASLITGAGIGSAMSAHSIGLLALPSIGLVYLLFVRRPLGSFLAIGSLIFFTALIVGGGQFLDNTIRFGVPVHDSEPVWDLPQLENAIDLRYRRELVTVQDRLVNGLFGWMTTPRLFSYVHLIALIVGMIYWRRLLASWHSKVFLMGLATFYGIGVTLMLLGSELMIKNFRYMLTMVPFIVFVAGLGFANGYEFLSRKISD